MRRDASHGMALAGHAATVAAAFAATVATVAFAASVATVTTVAFAATIATLLSPTFATARRRRWRNQTYDWWSCIQMSWLLPFASLLLRCCHCCSSSTMHHAQFLSSGQHILRNSSCRQLSPKAALVAKWRSLWRHLRHRHRWLGTASA